MQHIRQRAAGRLFNSMVLSIALLGGFAAAPKTAFAVDNNSTRIGPQGEYHLEVITIGDGAKTNGHVAIGLTYGIGPDNSKPFGRTEIGFDYILSAGPFAGAAIPQGTNTEVLGPGAGPGGGGTLSGSERLFYGAKTQLYEDKSSTRVVMGGYLFGTHAQRAPNLGYVAVSHQFPWGYAHTGIVHSFAADDVIATPAGHHDHTYFQLDYAKVIRPKLVAGFNFYTGRSVESVFFPAVILFLSDTYDSSVTIGDFRFNDRSVKPSPDQVYVQFDYYFGGPSHKLRLPPPPQAPPAAPPAPAPTTTTPAAPAPPAPSGGGA